MLFEDKTSAEEFLDTHFGKNDPKVSNPTQFITQEHILDREKWDRILARKKNKSAPGEDKITYEMLKRLQPNVTENIIRDQ